MFEDLSSPFRNDLETSPPMSPSTPPSFQKGAYISKVIVAYFFFCAVPSPLNLKLASKRAMPCAFLESLWVLCNKKYLLLMWKCCRLLEPVTQSSSRTNDQVVEKACVTSPRTSAYEASNSIDDNLYLM